MAKINIPIPDGPLDDVNARARAVRIRTAITKMRAVSEQMPPGTDGTAIIRRFRDALEPCAVSEDRAD